MASTDFEQEETRFRALYAAQQPQWQRACDQLTMHLARLLESAPNLEVSKVEGRIKDVDECVRKFVRKYRPALEEANLPYEIHPFITDLIGVRVVCLYEDQLEQVAQTVRPHFDVVEITDKTAAVEGTEGSFGYKGLHLSLRLPVAARADAALPDCAAIDWPFELQVRTIIQDSWSVLDHKIKYKKSIPSELKRRINVLAALFELADREFRQIRDATAAGLLQAPDETANETTDDSPAADTARRDRPAAPGSELNAFTFLKIAQHFFKDFAFDPHKVDGFVDDIRAWEPQMTRGRFNAVLRQHVATVKRYKQHFEERNPAASFNPYTMMRHCLYLSDRDTFRRALRNASREAFEAWLHEQHCA